uniref:Uncharacterized protein n=1 Tax=Arundo donax TaxID=35708 RepID=A0A0A9HSE6_ARUDO
MLTYHCDNHPSYCTETISCCRFQQPSSSLITACSPHIP